MRATWIAYLPVFLRRRIEGRPGLHGVLTNAGWLFADKIVRLGIGLVVGLWVARYLGPASFGLLSTATAYVALVSSLATLGLDGIVVRELVRRPGETAAILGSAFFLKLGGGMLTIIVAVAAALLVPLNDVRVPGMVAVVAGGTLFLAWDAIDFWFQSRVQSKYTVLAKNAAFILASLYRVAMVLVGADVMAFVWAVFIESLLGAAGLIVAYQMTGRAGVRWHATRACARGLLADSWPLILSGLSIMVYMRIGQIMLYAMLGKAEAGIYSAALRVSEVWYFIPTVIVSSVYPAILRAREADRGLYYRRLERLFSIVLLVALAIAVPMTFLSTPLMTLLFGAKYTGAGPILMVHIWTAVFVFLGAAQGTWDAAEGLTRLSLLRTVGGAIASIGLNILLIPLWGGIGAAAGAVVAQSLAGSFLNLVDPRTRVMFRCQAGALRFVKVLRRA
jgi:PST family polysaccharide transporter